MTKKVKVSVPPLEIDAKEYRWYLRKMRASTSAAYTVEDVISEIASGAIESWLDQVKQDKYELKMHQESVGAESKRRAKKKVSR